MALVFAAPAGSTMLNGVLYAPAGAATSGYTDARWLMVALKALAGVLVAAAALRVFSETAFGRLGQPEEALSFAVRRFGATLWVSILVTVLIFVGFIALIVPGIYATAVLAVALPVLVIEDLRGGAALKRSRELVKGNVGHAFSASLAGGLLAGAPTIVLELLVHVNGSVAGYEFVQVLVLVLVQAVFLPIALAVSIALYLDLRARKEPGSVPTAPLTGPAAMMLPLPPVTETGNPWS
jgi:hypothetical protein